MTARHVALAPRTGRPAEGNAAVDPVAGPPAAPSVLADRIAAWALLRKPGAVLPSAAVFARRFKVSRAHAQEALEELVARCILGRLPSGQFYRPDPAECRFTSAWLAHADEVIAPAHRRLECVSSRRTTTRKPPSWASELLGLRADQRVVGLTRLFTLDGATAARSQTYLHPAAGGVLTADAALGLSVPDALARAGVPTRPDLLRVEVMPAPSKVEHVLHLQRLQPAIQLTSTLQHAATRVVVAATATWLHPSCFHVVLRQPESRCSRQTGRTAPPRF